jgi:hypothetical protein
MQRATSNPFGERVIGVLRLDPNTYEEIERDESATTQALTVVVLAGLAQGIGAISSEEGPGLIGALLQGVLGWVVFSVIAYFVGTTLFATPNTSATIGQVLRTVGFAQAPKVLVALGFIPILGWIAGIVAWVWFVAAAIVALRHAFDFTIERAIGTAAIALLGWILLGVVLAVIFGIGGAILGIAF